MQYLAEEQLRPVPLRVGEDGSGALISTIWRTSMNTMRQQFEELEGSHSVTDLKRHLLENASDHATR